MAKKSKTTWAERKARGTLIWVRVLPEDAAAALRALRSTRPAGAFKGCKAVLGEVLRGYIVQSGPVLRGRVPL